MISLHNLTSLVKKRKRIGRGGSRGGTSTKGHKGQHARSGGKVRNAFEGGQMPLFRRLPKRGFINSPFTQETKVVNIEQLNAFEDGTTVDLQVLIEKGIVKIKKGVVKGFLLKVLGNGTLNKKLTISADAFSASAKRAIESLGGEARLIKEK